MVSPLVLHSMMSYFLGRYQLMGERESSYTDNPSKWQHQQTTPYSSSSVKPSSLLVDSGLPPPSLPVPAKSTGSLLSLWTAKEKNKANSGHVEFAGRTYGEVKAELYPHTRYCIKHHRHFCGDFFFICACLLFFSYGIGNLRPTA